ncbi:D-(-)-3-hydroxybutyrate oligomer hydrolase [Oleiagrimonas citrea]|uniref:Hydrogenase n=1 Tax=Oleiagrimonas citrea TaxID=1665687 RepID=A0A846ZMS2_9GAMM|nr:3-hydroxybutyrate oligomer hydrolase family protein [Oleiagrimonas citrea]NKZ38753.1 hydrogenase [Oleiagrimonas citrea]
MPTFARYLCTAAVAALTACSAPSTPREEAMSLDFLSGPVRVTDHRGDDDLLSAGLGLKGLAGAPTPFAEADAPTPAELRRRAILMSWKGIADLGPLGGYGRVYGGVPDVPGREYTAFARLPDAHAPHRVLLQAPDAFDKQARCLIVTASSGSRGVYGAISLAGAFGLPRGCAVAYTDKGTGSGYFDTATGTGVALDGTRARAGEAALEFEPRAYDADAGVAVKHMHSGDNPEADWGRDVLQAARFGLAMLDRAYPDQAPFTPENTRIIAAGLSNGGGAVLQAAGLDHDGLLDAVMAMEPNVHLSGRGRALYDYATEAALWMPCALTDARFDDAPLARTEGKPPAHWLARCASLHAQGRLRAGTQTEQAAEALAHLHAQGWTDAVLSTAASTTAFDAWRSVAAGYASAYLRREVGQMPCGFRYDAMDMRGQPTTANPALRAAWWSDASGIPPGAGVGLFGGLDASADPTLDSLECLRALWSGSDDEAVRLHASVDALAAQLPRASLPIWVVHGADDGLIPTAFTSEPYVDWLRAEGRTPRYWKVPHAQHFDAFLALPEFGAAHVPLMPYGYAALDALYRHVVAGEALSDAPMPKPSPRGTEALTSQALDLSP